MFFFIESETTIDRNVRKVPSGSVQSDPMQSNCSTEQAFEQMAAAGAKPRRTFSQVKSDQLNFNYTRPQDAAMQNKLQ